MKDQQQKINQSISFISRTYLSKFLYVVLLVILNLFLADSVSAQPLQITDKGEKYNWIQTARVFLMDAYQPPFAPELEYDAKALVETMVDMNANVLRFGTMGKYATIQGIRFKVHPDQGDRDLLSETIDLCKEKGIKVIPYISTGHKLAWSMVTEDYPEYGQKSSPEGLPCRSHMYVGEDHGTICWNTPYKKAFLEYVEHVVRDYDIDGMYFDAWFPHYFWKDKQLCYCDGCRNGFKQATGFEIPYHEKEEDYTNEENKIIDKYHEWYKEKYITEVVQKVRELVKSYKDIPLISNINNPKKMAALDPRIVNAMDAFLYERGETIVERAEGVSVPRSLGLHILPYVGVYHNWPRLSFNGYNYQQQIFTNLMFGGGSIIAQPTGYIDNPEYRKFVKYPFNIIEQNEEKLTNLKNYPNVGVVWAYNSPNGHTEESRNDGVIDARTSSLGAFSACLYGHVQVSSVSEFILDKPDLLAQYPILYLANIPYISEERIKNIKEYVDKGGCLIASYKTSLFNSEGKYQNYFGLEELLNVKPVKPAGDLAEIVSSYTAMLGGPNDLYLQATNKGNIDFKEKYDDKLFPLWYYQPVEVTEDAEILMNIVTGPDQKPIFPGVIKSKYGKGEVLYCTSALESLYNSGGQDIVKDLILKFIQSVNKEPAPYNLDAPESLIANLTMSENALVMHLTNWTGNKFEHPWRNEYYLAPVENVSLQIHIPKGKKIKQISMMVDTDFNKKVKGQVLDIFIPRVESYQGVVIDLE